MPHSLRARLSGLRYQKIISDKDYCRLCKALDNEKIIDKIRAEIEEEQKGYSPLADYYKTINKVLQIIDKHIGDKA